MRILISEAVPHRYHPLSPTVPYLTNVEFCAVNLRSGRSPFGRGWRPAVYTSSERRVRHPAGNRNQNSAPAILFSCGQGRCDDGGPLRPCQTFRAASAAVAHSAQPARPYHPRHPPQDRGPAGTGGGIRPPAWPGRANPLAAAAPARLEALFLPCPGGGMHRQRQGRRALRVPREGLHRHQQPPGARWPVRTARQVAAR
ncbi:hypothetical protein ABIB75_007686 [Bradyrhizobium sp. GM2.2]